MSPRDSSVVLSIQDLTLSVTAVIGPCCQVSLPRGTGLRPCSAHAPSIRSPLPPQWDSVCKPSLGRPLVSKGPVWSTRYLDNRDTSPFV
jgi:hypothetical protein